MFFCSEVNESETGELPVRFHSDRGHTSLRDRSVLALVVDLVTGRDLKESRVGLACSQVCDRKSLLAEEWAATHRKQIEAELLGVPVLRQASERLIVPQHTGVRDGCFADADRVEAKNAPGS